MGYAVVHMMKIKAGSMGGIQSHNRREHTPKTNTDIDASRTKENYDIVSCENYRAEFKRKVSNLVDSKRAVRKDAVAVCNFIVTSDQLTMERMGAGVQHDFFTDTVKWFAERYGKDRILNATVHMDETTPHLHIGIVPITADGRLSAKSIFTKAEMTAIQTDFAKEIGAKYGLERGIEGSERSHLSETRYKLEKATQELLAARESLSEVQGQINMLTERKRALESDVNVLEGVRAALQEQIDKLKDTAAATLVRVQERLDRTLRSVPERTRNEFMAAWSATKGITVEQAIKPKRKEQER